ncbi:MAG: hypothetical protein BIFFINMI_01313 [Phycisphaerae bacterium]|nr:hypothetical protein [Phycisphaerae bacterium]
MSIEPQIKDLADRLGKAMADSARTRRFKELREKVNKDAVAMGLLEQFNKQLAAIATKEQEGKPIEVADKHGLATTQEKIYGNATLKDYLEAQANYIELVQQVNDVMGQHLVEPDHDNDEN